MDFRNQLTGKASGNIGKAVFVKGDTSNGDEYLQCGVGDVPIGISGPWGYNAPGTAYDTGYDAPSGKPVTVFTVGSIVPLTYGGTVTAFQLLKPDANGKGIAVTSVYDVPGAIALEGGSSGEAHNVLVLSPVQQQNTLNLSTVNVVTGATTLTAAQSGTIIAANAADLVITMPTPALGLKFTVVSYASTSTLEGGTVGTTLAPAGTEEFIGNGFTPAAGKGAINTYTSAKQGDLLEVTCLDGSNWWITKVIGTWARHS